MYLCTILGLWRGPCALRDGHRYHARPHPLRTRSHLAPSAPRRRTARGSSAGRGPSCLEEAIQYRVSALPPIALDRETWLADGSTGCTVLLLQGTR